MSTMSNIKQDSSNLMKKLLVNKDVVDAVSWGNKVTDFFQDKKGGSTDSYHYQIVQWSDEARKNAAETPDGRWCPRLTLDQLRKPKSKNSLLQALKHFYVRLTYPEREKEFPLTYPDGANFKTVDAIKWVLSLMTEIHNPYAFFMEGESDTIKSLQNLDMSYITRKHEGEELFTNAYDLGRGQYCDIFYVDFNSRFNEGWGHIASHMPRSEISKNELTFGSNLDANLAAFDSWALETSHMRCQFNELFHSHMSYPFKPDEMHALWGTTMQKHLRSAGHRLSLVFNAILDKQKGKKLREPGGVEIIPVHQEYGKRSSVEREIQGDSMSDSPWYHVLFTNVAIISTVMFIGWFVLVRDPYEAEKKAYRKGATDSVPTENQKTSGAGELSLTSVLSGGKDKSN